MSKTVRWSYLTGLLLLGAVLLGCAAMARREEALEAGSWGLSYPEPGRTPTGSAAPRKLAEFDAAFVGSETEQTLYLTFDAGYENGFTPQILDVLKAHGAPAAFFVVGSYIERNPELVRRMAAEGHTVGNHTEHHWDMSKIEDPAVFARELEAVEERYLQTVGEPLPRFYRPPQGVYSEENLRQAQKLGYKTVFWSLAYVDWKTDDQPTPAQAFDKLIPRVHNGAVVLLHSTSRTNAEILDELLTRWESLGYRFGTLEELFAGIHQNDAFA